MSGGSGAFAGVDVGGVRSWGSFVNLHSLLWREAGLEALPECGLSFVSSSLPSSFGLASWKGETTYSPSGNTTTFLQESAREEICQAEANLEEVRINGS